MKQKNLCLSLILVFTCIFNVNAAVKLPAIFSDNMVLQQNTVVNIWGTANPWEEVMVRPSWDNKEYSAVTDSKGKWSIKIKTPKASSSNHNIKVRTILNSLEINNVLIGEVWLASGQSNMDFPVAKAHGWRTGVIGEEEEMKDADYPDIRLFHVKQRTSPRYELDDCEGEWKVCTPENLKTFSAVAFFFGRELYKDIKTPVGLIQSTWGGTPAEAWTKMDVILSDSVYVPLVVEYNHARDNYPAAMEKYEAEKAKYDVEVEEAKKRGEEITLKAPKKPDGINHNKALSTLWNGMIKPLVPYTLKGVIWYQGESNSERAENYTKAFSNMINSWRKEWAQGDFPFYFVQIAPHYKQPPLLREAQLNTWKTVKNTGMVVITDVGDSTDIHPRNKKVPGVRLAQWALANDYKKKVPYSGPVFKSMITKGNTAILDFDYIAQGLTSNDEPLKGFVIAGADRSFYPATATVKGNKIEVSSPKVSSPVAVRYGWDKFFRVNLYNGAGFPATPFRTDNWNE